jgi:hypothetical protein
MWVAERFRGMDASQLDNTHRPTNRLAVVDIKTGFEF